MARDHRLEVEEGLRGIARTAHVHREVPAGAQNADIWFVQIVKHAHISHHVGIARHVDHMPLAGDHEAAFAARHMRAGIGAEARGMGGVHHRHAHTAQIDRTALVETDDLDPFGRFPMRHQVELPDHRDLQPPGQIQHVGRVIEMRMRQQDMRRPLQRRVVAVLGQHRVAAEPRIDQQNLPADLDPERTVSQPCDFHFRLQWFCTDPTVASLRRE
jgi:hypothetical protein